VLVNPGLLRHLAKHTGSSGLRDIVSRLFLMAEHGECHHTDHISRATTARPLNKSQVLQGRDAYYSLLGVTSIIRPQSSGSGYSITSPGSGSVDVGQHFSNIALHSSGLKAG
jgi:hypothetical protein